MPRRERDVIRDQAGGVAAEGHEAGVSDRELAGHAVHDVERHGEDHRHPDVHRDPDPVAVDEFRKGEVQNEGQADPDQERPDRLPGRLKRRGTPERVQMHRRRHLRNAPVGGGPLVVGRKKQDEAVTAWPSSFRLPPEVSSLSPPPSHLLPQR